MNVGKHTCTIELLCDQPRCRTEGTFVGDDLTKTIHAALEAHWYIKATGVLSSQTTTGANQIKHYCPEHGDEHRTEVTWCDSDKNKAYILSVRGGFVPVGMPPDKEKKPRVPKVPRRKVKS